MAIKRGIRKTLSEIGKIKTGFKGKEITSGRGKKFRPPKKVDFFFITTTERDQNGDLIKNKAIMEKLGEKPRELKIRLPFDSIDKNFFTQYQSYDGGKKVCAGDGENAERSGELSIDKQGYLKRKGEQMSELQCDPEKCPIFAANKCKVSGILSVFLPDSGDLGGVFKYRTHSWNAVSGILGALEYFAENTGGILQGLPLKMKMVRKTTTEHGTIAYPTIVIDGEEIMGLRRQASIEMDSRRRLGVDVKLIEADAERSGFFRESDTGEDIQAEFYPVEEAPVPEEKGATPEDVAAAVKSKPTSEPDVVDGDAEPVQPEIF